MERVSWWGVVAMWGCAVAPRGVEVPGVSVRALEVVGGDTVLFAGSGGVWGCTFDAGATWFVDTLE